MKKGMISGTIDYKNSILAVSNSIMKYYGITPGHNTLPPLDNAFERMGRVAGRRCKNIVLMIFDGMGAEIIQKHLPETGLLRRRAIMEISSVFPPTTAAALTSLQSGKSPFEHGWLGWSCYFKEVDKCVDLFSNGVSGIAGKPRAAAEHLANEHLSYETILKKISNKGFQTYDISPYSVHKAETLQRACNYVRQFCEKDGEKFIQVYVTEPDLVIHGYGTKAGCVKNYLQYIELRLNELTKAVKDTLFIITADHGLIDAVKEPIEDYPEIAECLERPITLEPRCCGFFVKNRFKKVFARRFSERFGKMFVLTTHKEFIGSGILGSGTPHRKVEDFVGDYVAIAVSRLALWNRDDEGGFKKAKACHAGFTSAEMTVPLILIES